MKIVYCAAPLDARTVDMDYAAEAEAAYALGVSYVLVNFEALVHDHDAAAAVRRVPARATPELASYRGWMLKPPVYAQLYDALAARGLVLVNDPAAYRHCHHLPEWYALAEGQTPRSMWMPTGGMPADEHLAALLRPFGDAPLIVKDYVKSRKHEWDEACFIPSADLGAVRRVTHRFLELQGDDLNEGLVFRAFEPFAALARHGRSGMPLTKEFRVVWGDGEPLLAFPYWDEGDYGDTLPSVEAWRPLAQRIRSRFFTSAMRKCPASPTAPILLPSTGR
jgi:hypothetical protein